MAPAISCPQWADRRALTGISLRQSGHFLVVGSAGAGALRIRGTKASTGVTTKIVRLLFLRSDILVFEILGFLQPLGFVELSFRIPRPAQLAIGLT